MLNTDTLISDDSVVNNMVFEEERKQAINYLETMVQALYDDRLDQAEGMFDLLCEDHPSAKEFLIFPTMLTIQRGYALDALRNINEMPSERCPELKVLCLYVLEDPCWHGEAMKLIDDPNFYVRTAMRQLLCMPTSDDP